MHSHIFLSIRESTRENVVSLSFNSGNTSIVAIGHVGKGCLNIIPKLLPINNISPFLSQDSNSLSPGWHHTGFHLPSIQGGVPVAGQATGLEHIGVLGDTLW